jgi:Ca2+-binding EF-hand superfamily protein
MKLVAILAALGLGTAALAIAHPHEGKPHGPRAERLKAADANGDGMISRSEAAALPMIERHFNVIDTNADGQVTREELRAAHQQRRAERWKQLDADGEGRVSRAEAEAQAPRLARRFDRLDANRDGFLVPEEIQAHRHAHGRRT